MHCKQKLWNLLTICRKAGKMQMGLEPAKDALLHQTAAGLLLAADASENTKKEAAFFSAKAGVPLLELRSRSLKWGRQWAERRQCLPSAMPDSSGGCRRSPGRTAEKMHSVPHDLCG